MGLHIVEGDGSDGLSPQEAEDMHLLLDEHVDDPQVYRQQLKQVKRLKGSTYSDVAPRVARHAVHRDRVGSGVKGGPGSGAAGAFEEHQESMALVNWYRQSQKQLLLQRVLSQSLVSSVNLYPRFGKTVFFEQPFTNPFNHEERFVIELNDPELRIVTNYHEWLHLRKHVPASGSGAFARGKHRLGPEPTEPDMFDKDSYGNVQIALLANETVHLPFTFMTLVPHRATASSVDTPAARSESKMAESKDSGPRPTEKPHRIAKVSVVSGSRGHAVGIVHVQIFPQAFCVNRTLRYLEVENSMMKRRIQFVDSSHGASHSSAAFGHAPTEQRPSKFIHCVDHDGRSAQNNLVVEWAPQTHSASNLDIVLRYRCGTFPAYGSFYIMLYDDQYHSVLHEMWHVIIQYRQRLDVHGPIGASSLVDLVVRGDRFGRRARAFVSDSTNSVCLSPPGSFQLTAGAYNRVAVKFTPKEIGTKRLQLNLVDVDSRELISAWLLTTTASPPPVMRTYDVNIDLKEGRAMFLAGEGKFGDEAGALEELARVKTLNKKILFRNPWDAARRFLLSSSNESVMRVRTPVVDVAPHGECYLRLVFDASTLVDRPLTDTYLFLNDEVTGQNEECFQFRVHVLL
jgi:hypothetical protein